MPGDGDEVAEDGRGGRVAAGAPAVEHQLAGGVGLDEDGVEGLAHAGERVRPRDHRRVDAHGDAVVGALADRQQLDDGVHLAGRRDVGGGDLGDALAVDVGAGDPGVEGERGEDRGLGGGVEALDVGGRVGLGVAERLRLLDGVGEAGAGRVHLVEDVVGRAVDDAEHLAHVVTGERLAQRPQQRDRAGDRGLVVEVDAVLGGRGVEARAVLGEQRLVGGDDRGAVLHGAQDERAGGLDAADDLDDDVGARDEVLGVGREQRRVDAEVGAVAAGAAHRDADDLERRADPGGHVVGVLGEQAGDGAADDAGAEQGDAQRLGWRSRRCPRRESCRPSACWTAIVSRSGHRWRRISQRHGIRRRGRAGRRSVSRRTMTRAARPARRRPAAAACGCTGSTGSGSRRRCRARR